MIEFVSVLRFPEGDGDVDLDVDVRTRSFLLHMFTARGFWVACLPFRPPPFRIPIFCDEATRSYGDLALERCVQVCHPPSVFPLFFRYSFTFSPFFDVRVLSPRYLPSFLFFSRSFLRNDSPWVLFDDGCPALRSAAFILIYTFALLWISLGAGCVSGFEAIVLDRRRDHPIAFTE